ncbi:MAG: hypothetical protein GF344_13030 [Chitinivibrionales bacterium]|nr:hypothetical protein [Chitinivibrionales bacterium]MBD3357658.1 hypothetical protein [Chitinivibrionales bacterium]
MKSQQYYSSLTVGLSVLLLTAFAFSRQHQDGNMNGRDFNGKADQETTYVDTNGLRRGDTIPDTTEMMERDGMGDTARNGANGEFFEQNGYDTSETLSVAGIVDSVDTTDEVVMVTMNTQKGRLMVQTAPQWYLDQQGLSFSEGDSVKVTGRPQALNGKTTLSATKIEVFTNTMKFRKEDGTPMWGKPRTGFWDAFRRKR